MAKENDPKIEDIAIALTVAGLCITLAIPFVLWKSVEGAPEYYRTLTLEQYLKRSLMLFGVAGVAYVISRGFPEVTEGVLFAIGKLKVSSKILIDWGILNLLLAAVLYPTIPVWIKYVSKKKNPFKNELY